LRSEASDAPAKEPFDASPDHDTDQVRGARRVDLSHDTLISLVGWLITASSALLGAPFWFDLLQKLIQVRDTPKSPIALKSRSGLTSGWTRITGKVAARSTLPARTRDAMGPRFAALVVGALLFVPVTTRPRAA
jgi:hypothetical protein